MLAQGEMKPRLRDWEPIADQDAPAVSIIVPARNESSNIETCISLLRASRYPRLEIIVVNDRSTDDTLERARRAASGDARVKVVDGAELPAGWFGKTWACWQGYQASKGEVCWQGYQASKGEVLLFTDADTRHGPQLLGRAVAVMKDQNADLVSFLQRQEMHTFWERVIQPVFLMVGWLMTTLSGGAEALNRSRDPKKCLANGQYILVTRRSYEDVGGHQAIKGVIVEDLMMGLLYGKAGKSHWVGFAFDDMSTRMYDSFDAIVEGWGKNLFMALVEVHGSLLKAYAWSPVALLLGLVPLLPFAMLVAGLLGHGEALTAFGLSGSLALTFLFALILRMAKEPWYYAPLHPLGLTMMTLIFLRAMWRGQRRLVWRGRTYAHGAEAK